MGMAAMIPWGFAGGGWFALVAIPVIAAFFFRWRSRVHEIPALSHWLTIGRPLDVRSTGAVVRRILSLAAQILLIGVLVICLADPFPRAPAARRVAMVIDTSATMQTMESGRSRLKLAVERGKEILGKLPRDAQVYLVAAANRPASLHSSTLNPAQAAMVLDALGATDTNGDIPAAIRAISFLADDPAAEAIVISDFAGGTPPSALARLWHGVAKLSLIPVGEDHPDCAITDTWAEAEGQRWRIGAAFTSRGLAGHVAMARLISKGAEIGREQVVLRDAPGRVEFLADLPVGAPYEIMIDTGDALAVDDRAFGVLPMPPVICLVTEGDAPLERAIRANSSARLRVVSHREFDNPGDATVLIVDGPGLKNFSQGKLRGCLFINTPDPFGYATFGSAIKNPRITHWRGDQTSLSEIDPGNLHFRLVHLLQPKPTTNLMPVLSADQTPVIAERASDGASPLRIMYWPFALSETDMPTHLTFPILLWDTIDYLSGRQDQSRHVTGQPLFFSSTTPPQILDSTGRQIAVHTSGNGFTTADITTQGVYTLRTENGERFIPINLFSSRGTLPLARGSSDVASHASQSAGNQPVLNWRALLCIALGIAALEWILFSLRVVRIG